METTRINEDVTIAGQPAESDLEQLLSLGFRSVINFRADAEDDAQLSPVLERALVEGVGLEYQQIPISIQGLSADIVDHFRDEFRGLPKPVFAHCKSARRAGAMVLMHYGAERGLNGEQGLLLAEQWGLKLDNDDLRQFVVRYLDEQHPHQCSTADSE